MPTSFKQPFGNPEGCDVVPGRAGQDQSLNSAPRLSPSLLLSFHLTSHAVRLILVASLSASTSSSPPHHQPRALHPHCNCNPATLPLPYGYPTDTQPATRALAESVELPAILRPSSMPTGLQRMEYLPTRGRSGSASSVVLTCNCGKVSRHNVMGRLHRLQAAS
jgi:hypothetical protein